MAKLIQVIEAHDRRGQGTVEDPVRLVRQFFSTDGTLLMEADPFEPTCRETVFVLLDDHNEPIKVVRDRQSMERHIKAQTAAGFQEVPVEHQQQA